MENFALRLFNEDFQAVEDFLSRRITRDKHISISDFQSESCEEIQMLPTNRIGKPMIQEPNAVAYLGVPKNLWAYKVIATNTEIYVFYLTFMPNRKLASYQELRKIEKDWQVLLTRKYGKEYLEYIRQSRNGIYDAMKKEYDLELYRYRQETEELINDLSVTAFPISGRK